MLQAPAESVEEPVRFGVVPALASLGLASQLNAESRSAVVMGTATRFAWCALEGEVVLLASTDAVRFPNSILAGGGWDDLAPGDQIFIGSGAVIGRGLDWRVARWWDPKVTPMGAERPEVIAHVASVGREVGYRTIGLEAALAHGDRIAVVDAAREMLGNGTGLTPEGDDRLVGAFAAYRHVTASLGHRAGTTLLDGLTGELLRIASRKTTLLSRTLLRHALTGEVPDPVADVLYALTGYGSTTAALERCLALGGSSGRALVHGVICGARAGCGVAS